MSHDISSLITLLIPIIALSGFFISVFTVKGGFKFLEKYPPHFSGYTGEWLNYQTVAIANNIAVKRAVSIGLDNNSLHLKCGIWLFKMEATIPWSAIKSIKEGRVLWQKYYTFVLEDGTEIRFYSVKKLEERLKMNIAAAKILSLSNAELG